MAASRQVRSALAKATLDVLECGWYEAPNSGERVEVAEALRRAVEGSVLVRQGSRPRPVAAEAAGPPAVSFTSETSLQAVYRLAERGPGSLRSAAVLNFASAKNPGGGFLGGAEAQEESLARSSGLYPCLTRFMSELYDANRRDPRGGLYSDDMIFSPQVPFFRDDDGSLSDSPVLCSVITVPAVNAGIVKGTAATEVVPTMRRRLQLLLRVAASENITTLVLGAWGCGVFRNEPRIVAALFREALQAGACPGLREAIFAIPDEQMLETFRATIGGGSGEAEEPEDTVLVELISFGHAVAGGTPQADAVFSARHLENVGRSTRRSMTGLDKRLRKEVLQTPGARELLDAMKAEALRLAADSRNVRLAVGCEHGLHRSVALVEELAQELRRSRASARPLQVTVRNREQQPAAGSSGDAGRSGRDRHGRRTWRRGERVVREAEEVEVAEGGGSDG